MMFGEKSSVWSSVAFALVLSAMVLAADAAGQSKEVAVPQPHAKTMYRKRTLDERVKDFAKALNLDEVQQAGLKQVLERQHAEAKHIQFDESLSGADRISRFRALQQETVLRIRALLNEEQKQKYDPLNHATPESSPQRSVGDWLKAVQPH